MATSFIGARDQSEFHADCFGFSNTLAFMRRFIRDCLIFTPQPQRSSSRASLPHNCCCVLARQAISVPLEKCKLHFGSLAFLCTGSHNHCCSLPKQIPNRIQDTFHNVPVVFSFWMVSGPTLKTISRRHTMTRRLQRKIPKTRKEIKLIGYF